MQKLTVVLSLKITIKTPQLFRTHREQNRTGILTLSGLRFNH